MRVVDGLANMQAFAVILARRALSMEA